MTAYVWKGRGPDGTIVSGRLAANCPEACAAQLQQQQVVPLDIRLERDLFASLQRGWQKISQRGPNLLSLQMLAQQMASLLRAGIPLLRGIRGLAATTPNKPLAEALTSVSASLEAGESLAGSLARQSDIFPPLFISLVQAGESTGRLELAFKEIATSLNRDQQTRKRVWAALRYPLMVVLAIISAIAVVTTLVVPAFAKLFNGMSAELPWPTTVLLQSSDLVRNHWSTGLVVIALCVCGVYLFRASRRGAAIWDQYILSVPGIGGISRRVLVARIARALSMSLRSGVPALRAFTSAADVADNRYLRLQLIEMRDALEQGAGIHATARSTEVFSGLALQMIAVGEESGALDDMLDMIADHYEQEAEFAASSLSDMLQPVLLLVLAGFILLVALGVFLPIWEMSSFTG